MQTETQKTTLENLFIDGTIDNETIADIEKMLTRKKVEQLHKYKIMYNPKRDAWYTANPHDYNKRIQRKTRGELLDALKPYYMSSSPLCLQDIFEEWLEYKKTITESPNTIHTHIKHWKRFFDGTDFFQIPLKEITVSEINSWANQLIKKYNLSNHSWQTIKTIPKQMFEYAKEQGYILSNPFSELKVTVKFRQVTKARSETQVFNTDEYHRIVEDLWDSYDKKHEPRFLSVICNFLMGLRAGELCALRWRDLDMEKWVITIHQEMVRMDASQLNDPYYDAYKVSGQIVILPGQEGKKGLYVLLDHTKTHTERTIAIIPKGQKIFQLLKENAPDAKPDDFIFGYDSKYLNLRAINSVLEYACAHIETDVKRSHKLRKTYASRLNAAGLPLDQIRANLGHASLTTTLGYIYNPLTPEESLKLMEKAFDD